MFLYNRLPSENRPKQWRRDATERFDCVNNGRNTRNGGILWLNNHTLHFDTERVLCLFKNLITTTPSHSTRVRDRYVLNFDTAWYVAVPEPPYHIIPREAKGYSFELIRPSVTFFFLILCAYRLRDYATHNYETYTIWKLGVWTVS